MSSIKILHGNYKNVIKGVKADLIFTSPPYNIGSKGKRKDGQRRFGLYDAKSYGAQDYMALVDELLVGEVSHEQR